MSNVPGKLMYIMCCHNSVSIMYPCIYFTVSPLEAPDGVMYDEGSTSVTVSWQAVEDADRYTVTFTQTRGSDQLGLCPSSSHMASVSVDTTSASISVGQSVDPNIRDMLRAYTTYSITVVAESDVSGRISSEGSVPVTFTTAQTSMWQRTSALVTMVYSLYTGAAVAPHNVMATVVSSTVISVQWDGLTPCRLVNSLIVKYRVQYTAESSGEVQSTDESGDWDDGGQTSLTGLTPFTTYSIQVAAVNEQDDVGPYSDPMTARTGEDSKLIFPCACDKHIVINLSPFPLLLLSFLTPLYKYMYM